MRAGLRRGMGALCFRLEAEEVSPPKCGGIFVRFQVSGKTMLMQYCYVIISYY